MLIKSSEIHTNSNFHTVWLKQNWYATINTDNKTLETKNIRDKAKQKNVKTSDTADGKTMF